MRRYGLNWKTCADFSCVYTNADIFYNVLVIHFFYIIDMYWNVSCILLQSPSWMFQVMRDSSSKHNHQNCSTNTVFYIHITLLTNRFIWYNLHMGISETSICWYTFLSPTPSSFFHLNTNQSTRSAYMPFREKKRLLLYIVSTIMKVYLYNIIFCIYICLVHVITRTFLQ